MQFRKKPVVIDAIQFDGNNGVAIQGWSKGAVVPVLGGQFQVYLVIPTLEGVMEASVGDWIIKGVKGEFYPCKPDIFDETYDPVDELIAEPV